MRKVKVLSEKPVPMLFVHYRSHMGWPWTEPGFLL
jgi:hypothetical protein